MTMTHLRRAALLGGACVPMALALIVTARAGQGPKQSAGQRIWQAQCAKCHGAKGEGGAVYARPLTGKLTVAQLAKFVHSAMPPSKHASLPEAQAVAQWMYDAFYSPIAQERNKPARVALSRLTVGQFRNAVADLIGTYHPAQPQGNPQGLWAMYFKSREFDQKDKVIERVDPTVNFDFGTAAPAPDKFDPRKFSAMWVGSVLAPDTGEYDFVIRSDQSFRLFVNDGQHPLIDGWVKSGKDTEFHGAITLLGGRAYPIRLEFSKSTQGVDDTEKTKNIPPGPASVFLLWKRPKMALETIPARCLFPADSPRTFVVTAPFPPDDRSLGYERGNSISKEWDDATTAAALETAGYVADNLRDVTGVPDDAKDRVERLKGYAKTFVERAFRRPLDKDLQALYIDRQFQVAPNPDMAIKRVVLMTLKSPRFLFREVAPNGKDAYATAAQLSFGLWDSLPDPELLKAAASGGLSTTEGVTAQATRMANDPRAWGKLREFLLRWLRVDEVPEIVKSSKRYPGFDPAVVSDLRTSLELFLKSTAWDKSDYRDLMLGSTEYLNGRLAKMYGVDLPATADFSPVALDQGQRAGVLMQPYVLARYAYLENSSPIHRGVLLARSFLGRTLNPPPQAFVPLAASLHPDLTTRERVSLQTKPAMCTGCHGLINPLGFTLEKFDAIGRLRDKENGKPVDCSGAYQPQGGKRVEFAGPMDLAKYLADSDEAHASFVEKLFHHLVKQPVLAYGPKTLDNLQRKFEKDGTNIKGLMVQTMVLTTVGEGKR